MDKRILEKGVPDDIGKVGQRRPTDSPRRLKTGVEARGFANPFLLIYKERDIFPCMVCSAKRGLIP